MDETVKPKMGRPPKPIDWKIFEQLCNIQCTHDEIASFLQIAKATLYERAVKEYGDEDFPTIYKRFAEGGKCSLRRNQFKLSATNAAMCIWLGKNWLGQKDKSNDELEFEAALTMRIEEYKSNLKKQEQSEIAKLMQPQFDAWFDMMQNQRKDLNIEDSSISTDCNS
jgi:hypothetical protein